MAITNAQQAKQIMNEGRPMKKIKGQDHMLAYITPNEADKLVKLGGQETMTKEGIPAYPEFDNYTEVGGGTRSEFEGGAYSGTGNAGDGVIQQYYSPKTKEVVNNVKKEFDKKERERTNFIKSIEADKKRSNARKRAIKLKRLEEEDDLSLRDKLMLTPTIRTLDDNLVDVGAINPQGMTVSGVKVPSFITGAASAFKVDPSTKYFDEDSIREIGGRLSATQPKGITATQANTLGDIREDITMRDNILDPNVKVSQSEFNEYINRNKVENIGDGDGPQDPCKGPNPPAYCFVGIRSATPEVEEEDPFTPNYRLMADGGRAEFKDGEGIMQMASSPDPMDERNSMMETIAMEEFGKPLSDLTDDEIIQIELFMEEMSKRKDEPRVMAQQGGRIGLMEGGMPYEGGIMDLETSRQMYGLGKLVKKITRGVKKIAKSPIGKAAIGAAIFGGFGGGKGIGKFLFGAKARNQALLGKEGFLGGLGLTKGFGSYMPTALGGIAASTLGSYLLTPKEEDNDKELYAGADIDDPKKIMANTAAGKFDYYNYRNAADGGLMRLNYQEGGDAEPVAKKTMPLLDMDGQEMDLRAEGGFVPLGRMERADDVPARLSKNEFVFTADAVRNAGEGDVDKGAEVMYNMMKNLESGGEVSEESQGLEGAREMFQTSQRLEEVI